VQKRAHRLGLHPAGDGDARVEKLLRAACRQGGRVRHGVDHTAHARSDEGVGARSGAAGVAARLEGDDGCEAPGVRDLREGIHLGVGGSGTAVPPLGDDRAGRVEKDTSNLGVAANGGPAGGEIEGVQHRLVDVGA
jgi:hypothetical protein